MLRFSEVWCANCRNTVVYLFWAFSAGEIKQAKERDCQPFGNKFTQLLKFLLKSNNVTVYDCCIEYLNLRIILKIMKKLLLPVMQTLYNEVGVERGCGGMVPLHDESQNCIINGTSILKLWAFFLKLWTFSRRWFFQTLWPQACKMVSNVFLSQIYFVIV